MTDYHTFTTKDTPKADRDRMGVGDIWINAVMCKKCGETIRSKNRHDFVQCKCKSVFVDGGSWYLRRGGDYKNMEDKTELYTDI